jgi:riboflavin kinase/FMN adenylyltransferase
VGLLADRIGAAGVVTGEDFTFGKQRGGNVAVLRELGAPMGCRARGRPGAARWRGGLLQPRARGAQGRGLHHGRGAADPAFRHSRRGPAWRQGRPHDQFPHRQPVDGQVPAPGLWHLCRERAPVRRARTAGAANVGIRPTFDPPKELLEPHFFDFSGDLYGQELEVSFHHFLRPEAKFDSLDALVAQMARDCLEARRLLESA